MNMLVAVLIAFVVGLGSGWFAGSDHEVAKLAKTYAKSLEDKDKAIEAQRVTNGKLEQSLQTERDSRAADRITFERRLANVRKQPEKLVDVECPAAGNAAGVPQPAAAAVPRVRFTADFARLWNDGLAIGATAGERSGWPDGQAAGSGVVDPADLIANLGQNAERWGECRTQVRGWQAWACKHGHAAGAQCENR